MDNNNFNDVQFIKTGSIITDDCRIVILYDTKLKKSSFIIEKEDMDFVSSLEFPAENRVLKFDKVFNPSDFEVLYQVLEDVDVQAFDESDDKNQNVLNQLGALTVNELKKYFPECSADCYNNRKDTLKYISDRDKGSAIMNSYFSPKENEIHISSLSFLSPNMLFNAVAHETIHAMATPVFNVKEDLLKEGLNPKGIKKAILRKTGFESRLGYGRGLNEGFVQMYANLISDYNGGYKFEARAAEMTEYIFCDSLAEDYFNADISKIYELSEDKGKVVKFIKALDNYNLFTSFKTMFPTESNSKLLGGKHDFMTVVQKELMDFYFESVNKKIIDGVYNDKTDVIDSICGFKEMIIFEENFTEVMGVEPGDIDVESLSSLKDIFSGKVEEVNNLIYEYIDKDNTNEADFKFAKELKKICGLTCKITDIKEILDVGFLDSMTKNEVKTEDDKVYLVSKKINSDRNYYVVKEDMDGNVSEILNDELTVINEKKDTIVYDGLDTHEEARLKDIRYLGGSMYSVYRTYDGEIGLGNLVDKTEGTVRKFECRERSIAYDILDDSAEDFSYLDDYKKSEIYNSDYYEQILNDTSYESDEELNAQI